MKLKVTDIIAIACAWMPSYYAPTAATVFAAGVCTVLIARGRYIINIDDEARNHILRIVERESWKVKSNDALRLYEQEMATLTAKYRADCECGRTFLQWVGRAASLDKWGWKKFYPRTVEYLLKRNLH